MSNSKIKFFYLEEGILLLRLELVGPENLKPPSDLLIIQTTFVALKQFEDIIDNNSLKVDFVLVIKIFSLKLDLGSNM